MPHLEGKPGAKPMKSGSFSAPKNPNTTVQADSKMVHGRSGTGNAAIDSSSKDPESHSGSYNKMAAKAFS